MEDSARGHRSGPPLLDKVSGLSRVWEGGCIGSWCWFSAGACQFGPAPAQNHECLRPVCHAQHTRTQHGVQRLRTPRSHPHSAGCLFQAAPVKGPALCILKFLSGFDTAFYLVLRLEVQLYFSGVLCVRAFKLQCTNQWDRTASQAGCGRTQAANSAGLVLLLVGASFHVMPCLLTHGAHQHELASGLGESAAGTQLTCWNVSYHRRGLAGLDRQCSAILLWGHLGS